MDFKKAYNSVRRKVLYNIFIEFGMCVKLVKKGKVIPLTDREGP
jgi:hypothetical protein